MEEKMSYKMPCPKVVASRYLENKKIREENKMKPHTLRKYVGLTLKTSLHISRPSKKLVDVWITMTQEQIEILENELIEENGQLLLNLN